MPKTRVWARLLGLRRAVVEEVVIGDEGEVVVAVRPTWRERDRSGECRRGSPGFDQGDGRRRWRALDLGTTQTFLEAEAPRVTCRRHGVVACAVPCFRGSAERRVGSGRGNGGHRVDAGKAGAQVVAAVLRGAPHSH